MSLTGLSKCPPSCPHLWPTESWGSHSRAAKLLTNLLPFLKRETTGSREPLRTTSRDRHTQVRTGRDLPSQGVFSVRETEIAVTVSQQGWGRHAWAGVHAASLCVQPRAGSFSLKPPLRLKTSASLPRDQGGNNALGLGDIPQRRDKPRSPPKSVTVRAVFPKWPHPSPGAGPRLCSGLSGLCTCG